MIAMLVIALHAAMAQPSKLSLVHDASAVDTSITVSSVTRLRIDAAAGRITVRTWNQNVVRLVVTARPGTKVDIESTSSLLSVHGNTIRGGVDDADYDVTVPRQMGITLNGGDVAIDVSGTEGEVIARNYSGLISLAGGKGVISLKSTLGEIQVKNANGRIGAQSVNAAIRLTDVVGDIDVETSSSHVYLTRANSHNLTASTVGGVISFSGPLHSDGHYTLTTHSGSITLAVPEPVNATLSVSTVSGAFSSSLPRVRQEGTRRGRFSLRFGGGSATVDLQTFNGAIVLKPL